VKINPGDKVYHEDRLVKRVKRLNGKVVYQGKRPSRACPLTKEEVRVYVKEGTLKAISFLVETRGLSMADARQLLDSARGPEYSGPSGRGHLAAS
jgi:hypothetical protein